MRSRSMTSRSLLGLSAASLFLSSCGSASSDFKLFMRVPLPSEVTVVKMDGNWGNDPWRCWELSPISTKLKNDLITTWSLVPNARAFHGVATGGKVYCQYDHLDESYSASSDSYRAVGIKDGKMIVYFYNG